MRKDFADDVINNISADKDFYIIGNIDLSAEDSNSDFYMNISYTTWIEMYPENGTVNAYFPSLNKYCSDNFKEEDIPNIKKIVQILYEASQNEFDIKKPNSYVFSIETFSTKLSAKMTLMIPATVRRKKP